MLEPELSGGLQRSPQGAQQEGLLLHWGEVAGRQAGLGGVAGVLDVSTNICLGGLT